MNKWRLWSLLRRPRTVPAESVEAEVSPAAEKTASEREQDLELERMLAEEEEGKEEVQEGETLEQLLASEVFRFEEDSGKGSLSVLRFAEDILPGSRRGGKNDKGKSKKKRRTTFTEESDDAV